MSGVGQTIVTGGALLVNVPASIANFTLSAGTLGGTVLVETRAPRRATAAPTSTDPTQFPWLALRAGGAEREAADRAQERLRPGTCRRTADCGCGCGCGGGCR